MILTLLLVQVVERASNEQVKDSIGHGLGELARQTADKLDRGMAERYREGVRLLRDWDAGAARIAASIDADRMEQVLTNLLSNAIKFTPAGKTVTLGLARGSGKVRLHVTDQGPGIAPAFQQRVFQRFAQADGADSRTRGGTGLGLAISKAIIEEHGGTIGFSTAPERGTRFVVELPAAGA